MLNNKIIIVVFSCDRAMQLDATLQSFLIHCLDCDQLPIHILYKATEPQFASQYVQLVAEYSKYTNIYFHLETNFRRDLINLLARGSGLGWKYWLFYWSLLLGSRFKWLSNLWLNSKKIHHVLFLVDDNLFVQDFLILEAINTLTQSLDAIGFSLRLGRNTTYSYVNNCTQSLPLLTKITQDIVKFDWTQGEYDFGYPLELSSSIYRIQDLLPLLNDSWFGNPNQLESCLFRNLTRFYDKPDLLCFVQSITFCNPVNMVQKEFENRVGTKYAYSSQMLADKFDSGERIDVHSYSGFLSNACHQEVDFVFITSQID